MSRKLIHFRNTNDFARVEIKPRGNKPKTNKGVQWASCVTSIKKVDPPAKEEPAVYNIIGKYGTLMGDMLTPTMIFFSKP